MLLETGHQASVCTFILLSVALAASPRCVLPPVEQTGECRADVRRRRSSSGSQLKFLCVPKRGCCSALTCSPDRGEELEVRADGLSLFRRDSMENGPLNFTSLLFRTLQAAASGAIRLTCPSELLLLVSASSLEASSGKSCRIPLKCLRTIFGVI